MKDLSVIVVIAALSRLTAGWSAEPIKSPERSKPIQWSKETIQWKDTPLNLPKGAQSAVLEGDPKREGIFTMRVKLPPRYRLSWHTHPQDERVTVIEGTVFVGVMDEKGRDDATTFMAGSYYVNPAGRVHEIRTGQVGCVLQITGMGPWDIHFVEEKKTR